MPDIVRPSVEISPVPFPNDQPSQDFNRHLVADVQAARTIDRAHSSFTQARDEFILGIEDAPDQRVI